jgi:hypothetical protein
MAERVYLDWTVENWITVVLMVGVGMFVIGLAASAVRHYSGNAVLAGSDTGT